MRGVILVCVVLAGCLSFTESRVSSRQRTQHANHRYFDEFLLSVVSNGFVPPDVENEFIDNNGRSNEQQPYLSSNSRANIEPAVPEGEQTVNSVHQSLRNYIRRQHEQERERPLDESTTQLPLVQTSSEDFLTLPPASSDNEIFSLALQRHRSDRPEARRRHNRRNLENHSMGALQDHFRDIPREHWSCCTLGALAGDKGFLCDAQFYASRVLNRNANRVHNRRLTGTYFDNGEPTVSGRDVIQKFNSCVQDPYSASEFTSCCERSLAEYNSRRNRWNEFRSYIQTD